MTDILIIATRQPNLSHPKQLIDLIHHQIPCIETLALASACRTYSLLTMEARHVMLAIISGTD